MNQTTLILLLCFNLIATAILGTLVFKNQQSFQTQTSLPERAVHADLSSLQTPITKAAAEIAKLNETVQRFSTSSVQYDFLKREMDRLAIIDQTVAAQAQATAAAKTDKNAAEIDAAIENRASSRNRSKASFKAAAKRCSSSFPA